MKNLKTSLRKLYITLPAVILTLFIASCYYDYGITSDNLDLVATFYNTDYNFQNTTKYYLIDTVFHVGTGTTTSAYDTQIKNTTITNLNNLGWTRVLDTTGTGIMIVAAAVTSGTTTIVEDEDYCWYDYWGYPYCDSYTYSTTYNTGTVALFMSDLHQRNGTKVPIQWNATINGLTDQGNVASRITTTINQAFTQSSYLKHN